MGTKKLRGGSIFRLRFGIVPGSLLVLFLLSITTNVNAQATFKHEGQIQAKTEQPSVQITEKVIVVKTTEVKAEKSQTPEATIPYLNYKGISNSEQAKAEWINDNPEAYQELLNQSAVEQPAVKEIPVVQSNSAKKPIQGTSDGNAPTINQ